MIETLRITTYNIHKGLSSFNRRMVVHELRERLSSVGADLPSGTGPIRGLNYLENALRAAGVQLTAIRAGYFQENLGGSVAPARPRMLQVPSAFLYHRLPPMSRVRPCM